MLSKRFAVWLLLIQWQLPVSAMVNWCNESTWTTVDAKALGKSIHHVHPATEARFKSCYFYVRGINDQCNKPVGNGLFRFDLEQARNTCGLFGATLPTIRTKEEMRFFVERAPSKGETDHVVLGMTKVALKAEVASWDDKLGGTYKHPAKNWQGAEEADDITHVIRDGGNFRWISQNFTSGTYYFIFCKQNVTDPKPSPLLST